jgi:hypothetical protein
MSSETKQFYASEAFSYVDAYRSGTHKTAEILREEKEKLDKKYWENDSAPAELVAELRGIEHALNYVVKGEEPGLVRLGDGAPGEGGSSAAELNECRETLQLLSNERNRLEQKLKQSKNQGQELQAEMIRARQQSQALRRRLVQNNSTFVVVVATMFLVILVQLYLIWNR